MAHLWLQGEETKWTAHTLDDSESNLGNIPAEAVGQEPLSGQAPPEVYLRKSDGNNEFCWVVLAGRGSDIKINGLPLYTGICVLRDRDEIRWGPDGIAFYSTEELAAVVNLPHGDRKIVCPRCKQEICPETPAVQCPRCRVWHHQSEDLPCYTYAERCATCTRKTSLDTGYEWVPEEL